MQPSVRMPKSSFQCVCVCSPLWSANWYANGTSGFPHGDHNVIKKVSVARSDPAWKRFCTRKNPTLRSQADSLQAADAVEEVNQCQGFRLVSPN